MAGWSREDGRGGLEKCGRRDSAGRERKDALGAELVSQSLDAERNITHEMWISHRSRLAG